AGIEQVNNAVSQMDNVTQQNAALVEEASAASKAMEQQSTTLVQQIGYFRIAGEHHVVSQQPAAHQAASAADAARAGRSAQPRKPTRSANTPARTGLATKPAAAPLARASGDDSVWQEF